MRTLIICLGLGICCLTFVTCGKNNGGVDPVPLPEYGADANPTGDPVGGGNGYSKIVTSGNFVVHNADELLAAFNNAQSGNTILVASGASIDLTGMSNINIPDGITLAGDRGAQGSAGPLVFATSLPLESILFFVHSNVRISGLRFKGPDDNYPDINYAVRPDTKVLCFAVEGVNVEIENCEVSNFARGGVEVYPGGTNVHVHHCHLHDIHAYPVVALNRSVPPILIEANKINWIWHATAGSGYPGTGYEARYNIFVREAVPDSWQPYVGQHAVDMHAYLQVEQERGHQIAGDYMSIHHNTFLSNAGGDPSVSTSFDANVRGVPRILAEFYNNIFLHADPVQTVTHTGGNVWVYNNLYGPQQTLIKIADQATPQIIFHNPAPPDEQIPLVGGLVPININVNVLNTLTIKSVVIQLNGDTIYSGVNAPVAGAVVINTNTLDPTKPFQELTVTAIDNRGVSGKHTTVFRTE